MAVHPDILGKGWAFPLRFSTVGGAKKILGVGPAQAVEKVRMALVQIIGTQIGSRVIDRDFGSNLRGLVFTPIDQASAVRVQNALVEAITRWERRIEILNLEVSIQRAGEGVMEVQMQFRIISTQVVGNLVYAFYVTPEMRVQGQITIANAPLIT